MNDDIGPIYNVKLLDTLPLGSGELQQQMPSRNDLIRVQEISERTVAGYEVLLWHWWQQQDEIERLNAEVASLQSRKCPYQPTEPEPIDAVAERFRVANEAIEVMSDLDTVQVIAEPEPRTCWGIYKKQGRLLDRNDSWDFCWPTQKMAMDSSQNMDDSEVVELREVLRDEDGNEIPSAEVRQLRAFVGDQMLRSEWQSCYHIRLEIDRLKAELAYEKAWFDQRTDEAAAALAERDRLREEIQRLTKELEESAADESIALTQAEKYSVENGKLQRELIEEKARYLHQQEDVLRETRSLQEKQNAFMANANARIEELNRKTEEVLKLREENAQLRAAPTVKLSLAEVARLQSECKTAETNMRIAVDAMTVIGVEAIRLKAEVARLQRERDVLREFVQAVASGYTDKWSDDHGFDRSYERCVDAARCLELTDAVSDGILHERRGD
jgi:hypothetical protein